MEELMGVLKSDICMVILYSIVLVTCVMTIINYMNFKKHKEKYNTFLKHIGDGKNIQETLEKHMARVQEVENINKEIINYCEKIDKKHEKTLQKIGMIRYNAFDDVGSDLSFALALLDNENTGVVLNGIYARDMSNIYAKPIKQGKSTYTLTQEEKEAIKKAMDE